jgi:rhodanese-related sulfurtransferase
VEEMKGFRQMKGVWSILVVLVFALSAYAPIVKATEPKSAADFVKEAKEKIKEITVAEAKAKIDSGAALVILDVREPNEFKRGHVPKAINISRGMLEFQITKKIPDKNTYIIVYCAVGGRGALSTSTLVQMGYKNVVNMDGGWKAWVKAGYPVE